MTKIDVQPFDYTDKFMKLIYDPGVLLGVIDENGKPNVMTIGWCNIGIIWQKPIAIVYVRPSRHSYTCLEEVSDFTVNILPASFAEEILTCGTVSGRDKEKFKETGLTAAKAKSVKAPVIEEGILHYECCTVHYNDLIPENVDKGIVSEFYPQGDFHRVYFGEILGCYGDVDALRAI